MKIAVVPTASQTQGTYLFVLNAYSFLLKAATMYSPNLGIRFRIPIQSYWWRAMMAVAGQIKAFGSTAY